MKSFSKILLLNLVVVLLISLWPNVQVNAQPASSQELGISPFLEELDIEKGTTKKSEIVLQNYSDTVLDILITTKDFLPGDRGEPLFVPDSEINEPTFSLASWVKIIDGNIISLKPKESRKITYFVSPPVNAEQGTHYGAILFSYFGGKQLSGVAVTQSIGAIILVSYGQARSQGELIFDVSPTINWWNGKFEFYNQFINTGNVHVKPKGEVYIKNIFGKIVASPFVNRDASSVLPKSDRTFIVNWYPQWWQFGRYTAESVLTFGKERLEVRNIQTLWVLPVYFLVMIGAILTVTVWYLTHGRHWHRRRIIRKHLQSQGK